MSVLILATKVIIPPPRAQLVHRQRLTDRMNASLPQRLTLVSAPAGFGKTTLVSEWAVASDRPIAWLSSDEGDGDPGRFLAYMVSALQSVLPDLGEGILSRLQSPEPPPVDLVLTDLVNEVARINREHRRLAGVLPCRDVAIEEGWTEISSVMATTERR